MLDGDVLDGDILDGDMRDGDAPAGGVRPAEARPGHDAPGRSSGLPPKHQVADDELPGEDIRDAQRPGTGPPRPDSTVPCRVPGTVTAPAGPGWSPSAPGRLTVRAR